MRCGLWSSSTRDVELLSHAQFSFVGDVIGFLQGNDRHLVVPGDGGECVTLHDDMLILMNGRGW